MSQTMCLNPSRFVRRRQSSAGVIIAGPDDLFSAWVIDEPHAAEAP